MQRRDFIKATSLGLGAMMIPAYGRLIAAEELVTKLDVALKKRLADTALAAAKAAGASYCDVRIGRYLRQFVITREDKVQNIVNTESTGVGIRVIADGTWGFSASSNLSADTVANAARQAVQIAKANSKVNGQPVQLAPTPGAGEVSWATPIVKNSMEVPIKDKVELLLGVNAAAMKAGADFCNSMLFLVNEQKYFASTDGSYIDQDIHRIWPTFLATVTDPKTGRFQTRRSISAPSGRGYEYLDADPRHKLAPVGDTTVRYTDSYDLIEDATLAAQQAKAKVSAKSVLAGQYDLVLDPSHLWLTIHESIGHATELDRVLGYEANYAGTSFATLDKWKSGNFQYGHGRVNFFADKTQPGSLGAVGYDDEGVPTKRWPIIKDGILVGYQKTRDQAHIVGQAESDGCSYSQHWSDVQFQRMPNVSLEPGPAPLAPAELIKNVERGVYIIGDGSFSIDQQRYNFQFGGQLFYEIKNGEIAGMLRDVSYQSNTQEFWNSCSAICDRRDYALGGAFNDGKGQPPQISAVSHGSATARFDKVNVINTARRI